MLPTENTCPSANANKKNLSLRASPPIPEIMIYPRLFKTKTAALVETRRDKIYISSFTTKVPPSLDYGVLS